ncbi:unnamed protein product, partial [Chrysoparadoxa australica]
MAWDERHEQDPDLNLGPVVTFLNNALAMKMKGDRVHYRHLVHQLVHRDDAETLWRLYLGLSRTVSIICEHPEEFGELIDAIFRYDWTGHETVTSSFVKLVSHLVTANSTYLVPAMHNLVRNVLVRPNESDPNSEGYQRRCTRQTQVHHTLQTVITLVPSGCGKLFPVLRTHYPHKSQAADVLSNYAEQLLEVTEYIPVVR